MDIDYKQFQNQQPYPKAQNYTRTFYYKAGKLVAIRHPEAERGQRIANQTIRETNVEVLEPGVDPYTKNQKDGSCLLNFVSEKVLDQEAYDAAKLAYSVETQRLTAAFIACFEEELGIVGNPRAKRLYAKCYDLGHSAGYSEIMNYGYDLVELIKD